MIESLCNETFTSKTANDAWDFFEEVIKNTLEWDHVSVDDKQPTTITTTSKGSRHRVNPTFENNAKLTLRRLEALEISKGAQSSTPEPSKNVVSPVCVICDS